MPNRSGIVGALPHHSFGALRRLLDYIARDVVHGVAPKQLSRDYLEQIYGYESRSLGHQVMSTCRFFGLIESRTSAITDLMWRLTDPKERAQTLRELLERQYAAILPDSLRDSVTRRELEQAFTEKYGTSGATSVKGAAFFISAAQDAKLPISPSLIPGRASPSSYVATPKMMPEAAGTSSIRSEQQAAHRDGRRTRQTTLIEVADQFTTRDAVYCRIAAQRTDDGMWRVKNLVLDVIPKACLDASEQPATDRETPSFCYDYGRFVFAAGWVTMGQVDRWFLDPSPQSLKLKGQTGDINASKLMFVFPKLQDVVSVMRYPSHVPDGFSVMPWPHTVFALNILPTMPVADDYDFLVAENCPFFPDYRSAALYLIYGMQDTDRGRTIQVQDTIVIRKAEGEGWIKEVLVSPAAITVAVDGTRLRPSHLKVTGLPDAVSDHKVTHPGRFAVPLTQGLTSQVWIVLAQGTNWLDYVTLGEPWNPFGVRRTQVRYEAGDLQSQIQELIFRGEGPNVEFKECIPPTHDQMLKTLVAFANGNGGVLLLGIKDGTGDIMGVGGDVAREKDRIINMVRSTIVPEPVFRVESYDINGRQVIAVSVEEGDSPPYGLHPDKPAYYIRRGATTFMARQDEIRAMVLSRAQKSHSQFGFVRT
jgi:Schlafen, AlbA_2